jgi:hypothetical protein
MMEHLKYSKGRTKNHRRREVGKRLSKKELNDNSICYDKYFCITYIAIENK